MDSKTNDCLKSGVPEPVVTPAADDSVFAVLDVASITHQIGLLACPDIEDKFKIITKYHVFRKDLITYTGGKTSHFTNPV
jgi:hypothetical protein